MAREPKEEDEATESPDVEARVDGEVEVGVHSLRRSVHGSRLARQLLLEERALHRRPRLLGNEGRVCRASKVAQLDVRLLLWRQGTQEQQVLGLHVAVRDAVRVRPRERRRRLREDSRQQRLREWEGETSHASAVAPLARQQHHL